MNYDNPVSFGLCKISKILTGRDYNFLKDNIHSIKRN